MSLSRPCRPSKPGSQSTHQHPMSGVLRSPTKPPSLPSSEGPLMWLGCSERRASEVIRAGSKCHKPSALSVCYQGDLKISGVWRVEHRRDATESRCDLWTALNPWETSVDYRPEPELGRCRKDSRTWAALFILFRRDSPTLKQQSVCVCVCITDSNHVSDSQTLGPSAYLSHSYLQSFWVRDLTPSV